MHISRKNALRRGLAAYLFSCAALAVAAEPFVIKDIRVQGLQRVEPGAVLLSLPFRVGDTFSDDKAQSAIRAIIGLGSFQDATIVSEGDVVVVKVVERPVVSEVELQGFSEFSKAQLLPLVKDAGLSEGKAFDRAVQERVEQNIKRLYAERGFYNNKLETTVTPMDRNRVRVLLQMTENSITKIRSVHIEGAKGLPESEVLDEMHLRPSGMWSWYTRSDRYAETRLNEDLELIRSLYSREGFLDFKVLSSKVNISEDKKYIDITIHVSEGPRYLVSKVALVGNYLGQDAKFLSKLAIKEGQTYDGDAVAQTLESFTTQFGDLGYAFAKVSVVPKTDRDKGSVALDVVAEPGERAYVRQINIVGNRETRDEVIRREIRQLESAWYNGEQVRLSRDRINRLGFFKDVNFDLAEVPDKPDQADINVRVEEKYTRRIALVAGYSSDDKLSLGVDMRQDNMFGTGNSLALDFNTSKLNRSFVLSTETPYFTKDGVSRSFDVAYRTNRPNSGLSSSTDYKLVSRSVGMRFGWPLSELDRVYVGFAPENIVIERVGKLPLPAAYQDYVTTFGKSSYAYPISLGWVHDSRDSVLTPTKGNLYGLGTEISPAGSARYVLFNANYQHYIPLTKRFTFAFNTEIGYGKGTGNRPLPTFKAYSVGGIGSVRGFQGGSLGPLDRNGDPGGAARKVLVNTEILFPIPGMGKDNSVRGFVFVDAGAGFAESQKITGDKIRVSAGLGFSWLSPIGPIKFSYAFPLRKQSYDKPQRFQFQIGTGF